MNLNADPTQALACMAQAPVLVMDDSSLSNLAATLSDGLKIYEPKPIQGYRGVHLGALTKSDFLTNEDEWVAFHVPGRGDSSCQLDFDLVARRLAEKRANLRAVL